MNVSNKEMALKAAIQEKTGQRPIGGDRYAWRIRDFTRNDSARLFIPWATPPSGRTELNEADKRSISWLFGDDSLIRSIGGQLSLTRTTIMFADTYAQRNGINMKRARAYWDNVAQTMPATGVRFTRTSELEPGIRPYYEEQRYALEQLPDAQRNKIVAAAKKYGDGEDPYRSAQEYTTLRAAEAAYVGRTLGALWVSLNWQDRDSMCGDTPRIYAPEAVRTPWLKEDV